MAGAVSYCGPRGEMVPVEGIRLRKDGEYTVVDAEIGGAWVEVIRERSDGEFSGVTNMGRPKGDLGWLHIMAGLAAFLCVTALMLAVIK